MSVKNLAILGSTGSVGLSAVKAAADLKVRVSAIAMRTSVDEAERQARLLGPALVAMYDEGAARELRARLFGTGIEVVSGQEGLIAAATLPECDTVLTALVGIAGLEPTLEAIAAGKNIALANKETLVAGGELVMAAAARRGVSIIPVDSEHSALFQCMQGEANSPQYVERVILTASGGPFLGWLRERLRTVTPEQALGHPIWSMGRKITVDSATMMNKGLELIEAMHLFNLPPERIDAVVHPEGIVHSLVEYSDRSVMAQLSCPDMELPIRFALTWPERRPGAKMKRLDLLAAGGLSFKSIDEQAFGCYRLCRLAAQRGGLAACTLSGANEVAVERFLAGEIGFLDIELLCGGAMDEFAAKAERNIHKPVTLAHIMEADAFGRAYARAYRA